MRHGPLLGATILATVLLAGPAAAQVEDAGTFRVTVDGREVGTDVFEIRRSGAGEGSVITAEGRARLQLPDQTVDRLTELQVRGIRTAVSRYTSTPPSGMAGNRIFSTVSGGVFTSEIHTPTGEAMRQFRVSEGAVVLDDWVAHHYHFVALRPRGEDVPVVIPAQNRQLMARLENRGERETEILGRTVRAHHLVLRVGTDDVRHVWVDSLNRVLKVEVPAMGYVAQRTEIPQ